MDPRGSGFRAATSPPCQLQLLHWLCSSQNVSSGGMCSEQRVMPSIVDQANFTTRLQRSFDNFALVARRAASQARLGNRLHGAVLCSGAGLRRARSGSAAREGLHHSKTLLQRSSHKHCARDKRKEQSCWRDCCRTTRPSAPTASRVTFTHALCSPHAPRKRAGDLLAQGRDAEVVADSRLH